MRQHQVERAPYRYNLDQQLIFWLDQQDEPVVVADCKAILSYALSNHSILMGWGWPNSSWEEGHTIAPIDGIETYHRQADAELAWDLAMQAGQAVAADALFKVPSPQRWVMLALWNLRPAGKERFQAEDPTEFVLAVLESLPRKADSQERKVLVGNYARDFIHMAENAHRQPPFAEMLKASAHQMLGWLESEQWEDHMEAELDGLRTRWDHSSG